MSTFEKLNLTTPLLRALQDLQFTHATPIQEKSFSVIMSGRDVVGIAQTGTGKTFAYLLPLLRNLTFTTQRDPRILIMVPTRELVLQLVKDLESLTPYMNVRIIGVFGGVNINSQRIIANQGLDIVVATPGRLIDLVNSGNIRLKAIQKLVIDEVDEMLDAGFRTQLELILDQLPTKKQNLLFSATMNKEVENIIDTFFNNPEKVSVSLSGDTVASIFQSCYRVPNFFTKINLLEYLLQHDKTMKKVLIFVDDRRMADRIFKTLEEQFLGQLGVVHSNKAQNTRINTMNRFDEGRLRVLIATDLMARGLDLYNVSHVINFDTPIDPENYIHRIGRTGRAENEGHAISIISDFELEYQAAIEKFIGNKIPENPLPEFLKISTLFTPDEKPNLGDKDYRETVKVNGDSKAFHKKSDKNSKVNLGSNYKRNPPKNKPVNRGRLKRKYGSK